MLGWIITILGGYSAYQFWAINKILSVIIGVLTLYQTSSLNEMTKEKHGLIPSDKFQTSLNILSTIIILIFFGSLWISGVIS